MLLAVSNNIVSRCVIGRKADEEEENIGKSNKYGELLRRLEEQLAAFCIGDMFPSLGWLDDLSGLIGRLNATARALDALLDQVIEEHINKVLSESADVDDQSDKKDFADVLLHLWKDSMLGTELSQDNLKAIILVCLFLLTSYSQLLSRSSFFTSFAHITRAKARTCVYTYAYASGLNISSCFTFLGHVSRRN